MASETNASPLEDRRPWIAAVAVSAGFAIVGTLLWRPVSVGVLHDDGVYVLLGKALATGEGLRYAGVPGAPPGAKFPPLYPLVLAALWRVFPSFPDNVMVFEGLNVALLALAGGLFTAFQQRFLGFGPTLAIAGSTLGFISIHVWQVAALPLSEPFFLLLAVAALWTSAEMERRPDGSRGRALLWVLLVASMGAVMYARTAGVVFPLALCLALLTRRRSRDALIVLGTSLTLLLPWSVWSNRAVGDIPLPMRDILGPYGPWLLTQILEDPLAYAGRLVSEASLLMAHHATAVLPELPPPVRLVALITVAPVLALGARSLWSRSRTPVVALAGYLALAWIWPFKEFRLIVPGLPLLALLLVAGVQVLRVGAPEDLPGSVRVLDRPVIRRLGIAAAAAWSGWFLVWTSAALARGEHRSGFPERTAMLFDAVQTVVRQVPTDAVVGAPDAWAALALYTGREAAPSARFLPFSTHGPRWGTPHEQLTLWRAAGLDFLLVEWRGTVHGETLAELTRRCGDGAYSEVQRLVTGAMLVDLTPSAGCDAFP